MIKVQVVRKIGLGIAGASGLIVSGGGAIGCSGNANDVATSANNNLTDTASAGTGTITLNSYSIPAYASTSGGDEYIRTGETLTFSVDFADVWELIDGYGQDFFSPSSAQIAATSAVINVTFLKNGATVSTQALPVTWNIQGAPNAYAGSTQPIVVPPGVDQFTVTYGGADSITGKSATSTADARHTLPVYGGDLPDKNAIFDTINGNTYRTRVIEGGGAVAGANLTIAYSDYRADTFSSRMNLDTYIGNTESFSRFGPSGTVSENGTIDYNIVATISFDNGQTFTTSQLYKVVNSDQILPKQDYPQRVGYEAKIPVPADATGIQVAFHVQAILSANYSYGTTYKKYSDGQQITVFDSWDNNASQNYAIPVESP